MPTVLDAGSMVLNGYLALLTITAAVARRRMARRAPEAASPPRRYAVLVPAHDEADVIGATLASFERQDGARLSVHVVADNCTDDTVAIATGMGADVHERRAPADPGKGPALGWLLRRLEDRGDEFDAVVIVDADTTMAPGFLRAMDRELDRSPRSAWQAYYAVSAPETSPSVATRYAALALRHYVRPLGRTAVGGSCGLFGNGMVFRPALLRDRSFSAHLTEDAEMQVQLLLDGDLVGFVPDARVEAEMPSTPEAARTQHARWELGRAQVARAYLPPLLRRVVARRNPHRLAHADAVLDQLVPPLSVLAAATGALTAVELVAGRARPVGRVLAVTSTAALGFHVLAGLRIAGAPPAVWRGLLHAPRLVLWKLGVLARVAARPGEVAWRRTARNASTEAAP